MGGCGLVIWMITLHRLFVLIAVTNNNNYALAVTSASLESSFASTELLVLHSVSVPCLSAG